MTSTRFETRLPIDDALPALLGALRDGLAAILNAPPGLSKTTVPLLALDEGRQTAKDHRARTTPAGGAGSGGTDGP